jgi:transposase
VFEGEVPTQAESLRQAVEGLRAPVWVLLEAGSMAPLVKWSLEPAVDRVIVCETRQNRWIANSEDKSDARDADRLARLLRMGEYKEVYVARRDGQELRELVGLYGKVVGDAVRAKNRLKAKFRQHGVSVEGAAVYTGDGRGEYLSRLRRPNVQFMLEVLYSRLDAADDSAGVVASRLRGMLCRRREYRAVKGIPGVGDVVASIMVAVIADPQRFPDKRKLWKYAGLSVRSQSSGGADSARQGGSNEGNRLLKYAVMVAARNAVRGSNRFSRHYADMTAAGIDPRIALKTIARGILAAAWALWKDGTKYREG